MDRLRTLARPAIPFLPIGLMLALAACGSGPGEQAPDSLEESRVLLGPEETEEQLEPVTGVALDEEGNIISGDLEDEGAIESEPISGGYAEASAPQGMTVYFGYDSTRVAAKFLPLLDRAAASLKENPSARMRLEGHTDERGTRAYNLALGERRAQSVRDIILEKGVLAEQVDWVSYGEELPAVVGQGEDIWERNRRVDLILEE